MRISKLPQQLKADIAVAQFGLGVDMQTAEINAKPGSMRVAYNYECDADGGATRVGGIEPFDGRDEPDRAAYALLQLSVEPDGLALGQTISGDTSLASGVVIQASGLEVAVTRVVGSFANGESVSAGGPVLGSIVTTYPPVNGHRDNELSALASAEYRLSIGAVPGSGPVRGVEIMGGRLYAWRDSEDALELRAWRSSPSGWQQLQLPHEIPFLSGTAEYKAGLLVQQGGASAAVRRVLLESGTWSAGTAAGRLIVDAPSGGAFAPGAAAGAGACTLAGSAQPVRLLTASATRYAVVFTAGSSEYTHGEYLQQGGVSAIVRQVFLQSGSWSGTAAGILVVEAPVGGNFAAGAAIGGGACTLAGPQELLASQALGRVRTDVGNLYASLDTQAIYGCDGVNREFELRADGVLCPLAPPTGTNRATAMRVHKAHLFMGMRGSVIHSSIGSPYAFSAISGAAELGTSDVVTDMVPVGGSQEAAAMMALCENSLFVVYGNSAADWNLVPLSRGTSGAMAGTAQDAGGVVALDRPGIVRYPASQAFGNFAWDVLSRKINPIAAGQQGVCSVFIPERARYRVWLADGTFLSGLLGPSGQGEWTSCNYGRRVTCAVARELGGSTRCFVGSADGWVYETDVGRSFAGDPIECAVRLHMLVQRAPFVVKQYIGGLLELLARSACRISVHAEYQQHEDETMPAVHREVDQPGGGLIWDIGAWDSAYWDVPAVAHRVIPVEGEGTGVHLTFASESAVELPHTLRAVSLSFTQRRLQRFL